MNVATIVSLTNGIQRVYAGEPILDTDEGVLIIQGEDGSSRTFNWDNVTDFFEVTRSQLNDMTGTSEEGHYH